MWLTFYMLASLLSVIQCRTRFLDPWKNACAHCDLYLGHQCLVSTSGIESQSSAAQDMKLIAKLQPHELFDERFVKCIHRGYKATGDLSTFVCIWSSALGCQLLANESLVKDPIQENSICHICAKYCGCEEPSKATTTIDAGQLQFICIILISSISHIA